MREIIRSSGLHYMSLECTSTHMHTQLTVYKRAVLHFAILLCSLHASFGVHVKLRVRVCWFVSVHKLPAELEYRSHLPV